MKIFKLFLIFLIIAGGAGVWTWQKIRTAGGMEKKALENILLLGYGGEGHDGAKLTDTIMILHINAASKSAVLVSIPRDLWVEDRKINAFYEEGPEKLKGVVYKITGWKVDKYAGLDFAGFREAVDLIGGIEVGIEKTFEDPEYPIAGKENDPCYPCRFETIRFEAGVTHMDGATALKFVRSRHAMTGEGTDFSRAARQRQVLLALKDKWPQLPAVFWKIKDHVNTDLSLADAPKNFLDYLNYKVAQVALTDENVLDYGWSADGQMILVPKEGVNNWGEIRRLINI